MTQPGEGLQPLPWSSASERSQRNVGQQTELARTLHRAGQLALVATAATGDASGADLALLRELTANSGEILVVDDVDLVPAIRAGLAPACAGGSLSIAAAPAAGAAGLLATARLTCHLLLSPRRLQTKSPRSRDSEECIGRKADRLPDRMGAIAIHIEPALHLRARDQAARGAPLGRRPFMKRSGLRSVLERNVVVRDAGTRRRRGEIGRVGRDVALGREAVPVATVVAA